MKVSIVNWQMSLTMFAFFEIYKLHTILHYVENQNIPSKIRTASKVAGMLAFTKYNFIQIVKYAMAVTQVYIYT